MHRKTAKMAREAAAFGAAPQRAAAG